MSSFAFAIQDVVRRTGLTAHVIRIWEKRYGAVAPHRTGTNRRRYSEEQIERLALLRQLTQAGQSIGYAARLPAEALRKLAADSMVPVATPRAATAATTPAALLDECLAAVMAFDAHALEEVLRRAETNLGGQGLLQRVAAPLAQAIGALWRDGTITAAHEHFASAVLRTWLAKAARSFAADSSEPVLIVATPAGQLHELGALLVGALATYLGWRVIYLGASLPAPEIANAAKQQQARAVALSLVYPDDDPRLESELVRLRELLPPETKLITGGRAAPAYRETLARVGAVQTNDLAHLGATLDELRVPAKRAKR